MLSFFRRFILVALTFAVIRASSAPADLAEDYKTQVVADVAAMQKQTQVMIDMIFSFGEVAKPSSANSRVHRAASPSSRAASAHPRPTPRALAAPTTSATSPGLFPRSS